MYRFSAQLAQETDSTPHRKDKTTPTILSTSREWTGISAKVLSSTSLTVGITRGLVKTLLIPQGPLHPYYQNSGETVLGNDVLKNTCQVTLVLVKT